MGTHYSRAMDLAEAIRAHIGRADNAPDRAILAVVDKCEQMRAESANTPGGVGWAFANTFEQVIADALGINH